MPGVQLRGAFGFVVRNRVDSAWQRDDDFIVPHMAVKFPARHGGDGTTKRAPTEADAPDFHRNNS
jgi:hypothetical protein